ncbi:MAG: SUMF1/EgtB/PvdO family nonheme iron enzyme, partial [Candidatus Hodarchaeota archaeon]
FNTGLNNLLKPFPKVNVMETITNSLGMKLVKIPAGSFQMGQADGALNERPVHHVTITKPFFMGVTPVTNAQWEQFKPEAAKTRKDRGISEEDDSALIFVSWKEAVEFCDWLSEKEGKPYRLPSEAEWEYACRANSNTAYWMGEVLPEEHRRDNPDAREKNVVSDDGTDPLIVARSPANPWGLHDMHGVIEEWCLDWYGPYENPPTLPANIHKTFEETVQNPARTQQAGGFMGSSLSAIDPVGRVGDWAGNWKVTRGGAYECLVKYLRSATRMAQHPTSRSRFIGFRVVQAPLIKSKPLPLSPPPLNMVNVNQVPYEWGTEGKLETPIWEKPIPFINPPPTAPNAREFNLFPHNHCPAIVACDNGDVLVIWFSCVGEHDRDTFVILASRLVPGSKEWQPPSLFYKCPGRNMTGSSLLNAGNGRILHFNGSDEASSWYSLIMTMRESDDNGATWSQARNIGGPHGYRNQVISCALKTSGGNLIQLCDAFGGSALWISEDDGKSWMDPGARKNFPTFKEGSSGAWIAGIHAGVAEIPDGLLAFGRGNDIDGKMPQSFSRDDGKTWEYHASEFPPISWGQRLVLLRLFESPMQPLAFFSFTNPRRSGDEGKENDGIDIVDAAGETRRVFGLFSALSFDHGKTWTHKRLISDESGDSYPCMDFRVNFVMDSCNAEPSGYMAGCQTPDGMIHLISSSMYYKFNLAWLKTPMKPI